MVFDNTMTTTLTFDLSEPLPLNELALKMHLAIRLYESRQCNLDQAAEIAGLSKRAFIESMGAFGGSMFANYTIEDIRSDVENVRNRS